MTPSQKIALELIKIALHDDYLPELPNRINWQEVYNVCEQQSVNTITWPAIQKLQKSEILITTSDKMQLLVMKWFGYSSIQEKRFLQYKKTIDELAIWFKANGIDTLILKGLGLSKYYPVPNLRPCGDIDIYLFGDYVKANKQVEHEGIEVNYEEVKHSVFTYNDFTVENHLTLFDVEQSKIERRTESYAVKNKEACILTDDGYYILNENANYLFLLRHLAKHFGDNEGISLRQLVDFGLFAHAEESKIDRKQLENVLKETRLTRINDILVSIAGEVTGWDLNTLIFGSIDQTTQNKVFDEVFNTTRDIVYPKNPIKYLIVKVKMLLDQRWKYALLPESYYSRIKRAFKKNVL